MNYRKIAEFCKMNWRDEVKSVLEFAGLVCENTFLFNRPCDLERTEESVRFDGEIDWYYKLNGDSEFLFQFNRHQFLIALGQAYYLTGDEKYAKTFVRLFTDWLTRVPRDNGNASPWRSLEVGMRGEHWTKAVKYFENTPYFTDELKALYLSSLKDHAEILRETHNMHLKGSNWGVIQDSGLFAISLALGNRDDTALSLERLTEETELQIMSDGVHWEQSGGYHIAVLSCLLNVIRLAAENGVTLPEKLIKNANALASVCQKFVKPNHHQALSGDSDDNDIRNILTLSSFVLNRPDLKFSAYNTLDYESAWLFGKDGISAYKKMSAQEPEYLNAFLEDSGTYIVRTDWSENANYLRFQNGYTGGGHAHADKLHFDLMLGGRDVLVDGGRYTYVYNDSRKFFKGAKGHNTVTVGKKGFLNMSGAWDFKDDAVSVQYPVFENEACVLLGGAHRGYKNMLVERQILCIKPDIYIIIDCINGHKIIPSKAHQHFHFAPDGKADITGNTVTYTDGEVTAKMHFFDNIKLEKVQSEFSPWYNKKVPNDGITTAFKGSAITVIYGGKAADFKEYTVSRTETGIIIETPTDKYTAAIVNKELMHTYNCGGITASGKISVYRNGEKIFSRW